MTISTAQPSLPGMDDSTDMFGHTPSQDAKPSSAELEQAGQGGLFGDMLFAPAQPRAPAPAAVAEVEPESLPLALEPLPALAETPASGEAEVSEVVAETADVADELPDDAAAVAAAANDEAAPAVTDELEAVGLVEAEAEAEAIPPAPIAANEVPWIVDDEPAVEAVAAVSETGKVELAPVSEERVQSPHSAAPQTHAESAGQFGEDDSNWEPDYGAGYDDVGTVAPTASEDPADAYLPSPAADGESASDGDAVSAAVRDEDSAVADPEASPADSAEVPMVSPPAPAPATAPTPTPTPTAPTAGANPAVEPSDQSQPYRVLARKYRPQTFSELIGQEPMVRTLANAIERDRLAHAFLMTGVRGVGKTSTARLIAKALNCVGPDGQGGPTIDPCGQCEPCRAIAEGRHIDVIEMDAASHTGVDDVREIIEAVRYAAVSARYKIYIIDEVHMLSRNAFNALLKTLEEPPAHVKFLFATTEVDKLPVTVLSRTQRFDLRRIPTSMLAQHFADICGFENVAAEDEALHMIAAAAEGSVRDGLSILDQAIAHSDWAGEGNQPSVTADRVRDMLGLVDKSALRRLFASLMDGNPQALLNEIEKRHALGVEPLALLRSLMEITHRIAVAQIGGGDTESVTHEERQAVEEWARKLSAGQVHRLWQLLLKGHDEVKSAPDPLIAAQMALLRMLHAVELPDPGTLARQLEDIARAAATAPALAGDNGGQGGAGATATLPSAPPLSWEELVTRVEARLRHRIAAIMRMQIRVVELGTDTLRFSRSAAFTDPIIPDLREALYDVTGIKWQVEECEQGGQPSLIEQAEAAQEDQRNRIRQAPLVQAALAAFPGAEILEPDDAPIGERNWSKTA